MLPQENFVFSDRFWWYFDLNFTFSEDYTKYIPVSKSGIDGFSCFAAIAGIAGIYATRENVTPLYLPHPRNERAPHYRYICAQSVYIGTSVTRTRFFYCAISCWTWCALKRTFRWFTVQLSSSVRRAHATVCRSRHGDRHHG